jgi:hypothetical protein
MLTRARDKRARAREASKRYRARKHRRQKIFRATANQERLIDLLVRKGYLPDDIEHDHAMIEAALTIFVDDEGRK